MVEHPKLAICAIAKDEALYIEAWLAFHFLQSANEILIFDNESTDDTREIITRVARHAPISFVDWPSHEYYEMQMQAYLEGARRLTERADWVAFIDIDEFIFSSHGRSLSEELAEFGPEVGAVAVGHRIFGSGGQTEYEPELVTSRFVRCASLEHPQSRWFKTIARPTLIETVDSAHSVVLRSGAYLHADHTPVGRDPEWHPGHADRVAHGSISLFHYMVKSFEEFRWKQLRFRDKTLEFRYTDEFFREHDDVGNEMENNELCRFAEPIRAMISQWQD